MAAPVTTKHALFKALEEGSALKETANQAVILDYVYSVEREDGSGRCWNVRGRLIATSADQVKTIFVRTID